MKEIFVQYHFVSVEFILLRIFYIYHLFTVSVFNFFYCFFSYVFFFGILKFSFHNLRKSVSSFFAHLPYVMNAAIFDASLIIFLIFS